MEGSPASDVDHRTAVVGLCGMFAAIGAIALLDELPLIFHPAVLVLATAGPMICLEAVRQHETLDWLKPWRALRPLSSARIDVLYRLVGLVLSLAPFVPLYFILPQFGTRNYLAFWYLLTVLSPVLLFALLCHNFFAAARQDGCQDIYWHLGRAAFGRSRLRDVPQLAEHYRQWGLKAFFIPYMFAVLFGNCVAFQVLLDGNIDRALILTGFPLLVAYLTNTTFGTVGYLCTFRSLGTHIRSTQREVFGWLACMACYPPLFVILYRNFLHYHNGFRWDDWFGGNAALVVLWGTVLIALHATYAWSTMSHGLRFSNLTNRGVITNGPYRFFKHPAYLSKDLSWWMIAVPFVPVHSVGESAIDCLQLSLINLIYYLRAKSEERHLAEESKYRAYSAWIEEHGAFARARRLTARACAGRLVSNPLRGKP